MSVLNHSGLINTMNMPIKQPGEMGPKPMMANTENTPRHLICVGFKDLFMSANPKSMLAKRLKAKN